MSDKSYILEVVIGALVLIILSLILIVLSFEINFLPSWFFENLFLGTFTLAGAFFGAMFAGKFAVKSVEKQIESNNKRDEARIKRTIKLVITDIHVLVGHLENFMDLKDDQDIASSDKLEIIVSTVKVKAGRLENTLYRIDWMYIPLDDFGNMAEIKEITNDILSSIALLERKFAEGNRLRKYLDLAIWKEHIASLRDIKKILEKNSPSSQPEDND